MYKTTDFPNDIHEYIEVLYQSIELKGPSEIGDITGYEVKVDFHALQEVLYWFKLKRKEFAYLQEAIDRLRKFSAFHPG